MIEEFDGSFLIRAFLIERECVYALTKNPFRLIKLKSKTLSWLMVVLGGLVGSAPWLSTHNFSKSVCS